MIVARAAMRPFPGQSVSGDAFVVEPVRDGLLLAVVDALGHGPIAHEVAEVAVATIRAHLEESPLAILDRCHAALARGRGAAISVVRVAHDGRGSFAGVGNVRARIHPESVRAPALLPAPGVVGHQKRSIREVRFELPLDGIGLLHSDGVSSRVDPLAHAFDAIDAIPAELVAIYGGTHDDACVLAFAHHGSPRFREPR